VRIGQAIGLSALAVLASASGCSSTKTKPVGELVVAVQTDMQIPKDVNAIGVKIMSGGTTRFAQWYDVGVSPDDLKIPATLGVVAGDNAAATVTIQVLGRSAQTLRTLRQVVTTVPTDHTALLRMPVEWLCDGSATQPSGDPEAIGDTEFDTDCDTGQTCVAGTCVDDVVDSSQLPSYSPELVFGGASGPGAGQCFDTVTCFERGHAETDYRASDCTIPAATLNASEPGFNVALVTKTDGICRGSVCYVPLDEDPTTGWATDGDRVRLPSAVCDKLASGDIDHIETSTTCASKTAATPTCGPWSSVTPSSPGGTNGEGGASGEAGASSQGATGPSEGGAGGEAGAAPSTGGTSGSVSSCEFASTSTSYCLAFAKSSKSTCSQMGGMSVASCPKNPSGSCSPSGYDAYFYGGDASSTLLKQVCAGADYVPSSTSGTGGSGGSGGAGEAGAAGNSEGGAGGAASCTTLGAGGPTLIDDFETGDGVLPPPRDGYWQIDNDGTSTATQTPASGTQGSALLATDDGTGNLAMHTSGTGFKDYAQLQVILRADTVPGCFIYDASSFTGVSFRIKGTTSGGDVRFQATIPAVTSVQNNGTCTASCDDQFGLRVPLGTDWTTVTVHWNELAQSGFGAPATFTPDQIGALQWLVGNGDLPTFDFWLDDVMFTTD